MTNVIDALNAATLARRRSPPSGPATRSRSTSRWSRAPAPVSRYSRASASASRAPASAARSPSARSPSASASSAPSRSLPDHRADRGRDPGRRPPREAVLPAQPPRQGGQDQGASRRVTTPTGGDGEVAASGDDARRTLPSVRTRAESRKAGHKERKQLPLWQETLLLLVIALGLAILIKAFFVQAFYIPSASMERSSSRTTGSSCRRSPTGAAAAPSAATSSSSRTRAAGCAPRTPRAPSRASRR